VTVPEDAPTPLDGTDPALVAATSVDAAEPVAFTSLTRRTQSSLLPLPLPAPSLLPLHLLDPEMLERLVAELVSRRGDNSVQFYGRRGQKQYGLDIVEVRRGERMLYQVKRYQELTAEQIKAAVEEYAGPPRTSGHGLKPRRFDPVRFVLATSAELDRDTANVNQLNWLRTQYSGDLDIDVWGAEALSRALRNEPRLVHAIFGAAWAKEFCGYEPSPRLEAQPDPFGFVNNPVDVLGLNTYQAEAAAATEAGDHVTAAQRHGLVGQGLAEAGYPGHALAARRRQAESLSAAGDYDAAFRLAAALALNGLLAGEERALAGLEQLLREGVGALEPPQESKLTVLTRLSDWPDHGSDLAASVPALQQMFEAGDVDGAALCCLVIEQALVDGLYDFEEPSSIVADADASTSGLLRDLRQMSALAEPADALLRARLRCAVADASLPLSASLSAVEAAYAHLIDDAGAGRFIRGRGLVLARAAYAFGVRGETGRADSLWRQSVLASSEDGLYGDARAALRAARRLVSDSGVIMQSDGLVAAVSAMPNRRRALGRSSDPSLNALWAAHDDRLIQAFGDARRYLWESRLSGHLEEELMALGLFGDVLAAAGQPDAAVDLYVAAGDAKKAVAALDNHPGQADVWRWTHSRLRRRRAAATQVIGRQTARVRDEDVQAQVSNLLELAQGLWAARVGSPRPELDALKAVASFGVRIPDSAVDPLLALAAPALATPTQVNDDIGRTLVQAYWAVETRRSDLAAALAGMLALQGSDRLWNLATRMPVVAQAPLLPHVQGLAEAGDRRAVDVLARWGVASAVVQTAARGACAALLRRPVGVERTSTVVGTQESATVELLLALLDADDLVAVPAAELGPDRARPAGGVLMVRTFVVESDGESVRDGSLNAQVSDKGPELARPQSVPTPDKVALLAAGPLDELAAAVARHLLAQVEDTYDSGDSRSQALSALRLLLGRLEPELQREMLPRLLTVGRTPNLSEADLAEIAMDQPLSRMRSRMPGRWLGPLAQAAAAEAFSSSRSADTAEEATDLAFTQQATADAARLLRDADPEARMLGAIILDAVASAAPQFGHLATPLLFHPDERIRAVGAARTACPQEILVVLAEDPSSKVRAAVARRVEELPARTASHLADDPDLDVRRTLAMSREHKSTSY
jgi:hypothetical protein